MYGEAFCVSVFDVYNLLGLGLVSKSVMNSVATRLSIVNYKLDNIVLNNIFIHETHHCKSICKGISLCVFFFPI